MGCVRKTVEGGIGAPGKMLLVIPLLTGVLIILEGGVAWRLASTRGAETGATTG
jgi:hypothetical protein